VTAAAGVVDLDREPDGSEWVRWEPDSQIVAAVLGSPRSPARLVDMSGPDRCWLVAGLSVAGLTAKDIAERTGCSLRLVRAVRAEPMTAVCVHAFSEFRVLTDDLRREGIAHAATRNELAAVCRERDRLRSQFEQVVKKLPTQEPIAKCYRDHPLIGDNVYRHRGRDYCRECNRENTIEYRKRRRKRDDQQRHSIRMSPHVHAESVASA
jgi:hypothetical protein